MKEIKNQTCSIIAYGEDHIIFSLGTILEHLVSSGVDRFLVVNQKPFNNWVMFTCLLLKNKYEHVIIEKFKLSKDSPNTLLKTIFNNKGEKTEEITNFDKNLIYKFLIDNSDIVVFYKNSLKTKKEIEYAERNNKQIVFI